MQWARPISSFPVLPLQVLALAALVLMAACGSDFEQIDQGSLECVPGRGCNGVFAPPTRPNGPRFLDVEIRNFGDAPGFITGVELVNSAPEITFFEAGARTLARFSESGDWSLDGSAQRLSTDGPGASVPPNRSVILGLQYQPNGTTPPACPSGDLANCGTLVISTRLGGQPDGRISIPIRLAQGTGSFIVSPALVTFPENVQLGRRYVAPEGANEFVELRSTSQESFTITGVFFRPEVPGLVARAEGNFTAPITVSANNLVRWKLEWTPEAGSIPLNTTLILQTNVPGQEETAIPVRSGSASEPILGVVDAEGNPLSRIDLPPLDGSGVATFEFTLVNEGRAPLTFTLRPANIEPNTLTAFVRLQDRNGPITANPDPITAGNSRAVTLRYQPPNDLAAQPLRGFIEITSNDPNNGTLRLPLSAGPADPILQVWPDAFFWGAIEAGTSEGRTLELRNVGRATLEFSSVTLTGPQAEFFRLSTSTIGALAPGMTTTLTVTYDRPGTPLGAVHQAQLDLATNSAFTADVTIPLRATQNETRLPPSCDLAVSPSRGNFSVGDLITLSAAASSSNTGAPSLDFTDTRWSVLDPEGRTVLVSAERGVSTTFRPERTGNFTARVVVREADTESECQRQITVVADR